MNKTKKYADKAATMLQNQCKKKTNKLVYTQIKNGIQGKYNSQYEPKITKCSGTRIRYCTAKELKMMTDRGICECPGRGGPLDFNRFITSLLRNAAKAAAILGVAYLTYDLGFWGVPKITEQTFAGLCEAMPCEKDPCKSYSFKPKTSECEENAELLKISPYDPCSCTDPIPIDMEKCCYKMKQVWNHTVIFIFEGIVNAPDNIIDFVSRKWKELFHKECDPCRPMSSDTLEFEKQDECQLLDDYDEKYAESAEYDECEDVEAELKEYIDEQEEDGSGGGELPSCRY